MHARLLLWVLASLVSAVGCRKADPPLPAFPLEGPWPSLEAFCQTQSNLEVPDGGVPCGVLHDRAPAVEPRAGTGVRLQGAGFVRRVARMVRGDINSEVVVWVRTPRGVWLEPLGHVRREDPRAVQEVTVETASISADDPNRMGFRFTKKLETRTQHDVDTFSEAVLVGEDGRAWSVRIKEGVRGRDGKSEPQVAFGPGAAVSVRSEAYVPEIRQRLDAGTYRFEAPR